MGVVMYSVANTRLGGVPGGGIDGGGVVATGHTDGGGEVINASVKTVALRAQSGQNLICECYDKAFALANKKDVLSSDYRTGFEQCRARGGVDGGDAWTAGWSARSSARPYESSCKAYKKRQR